MAILYYFVKAALMFSLHGVGEQDPEGRLRGANQAGPFAQDGELNLQLMEQQGKGDG